ncbi:hypothetical protein DsansV1_C11g0108961 [Dioscorea sansibarensis]
MLVKALAHYFKAKLSLLDVTNFHSRYKANMEVPATILYASFPNRINILYRRIFSGVFNNFHQLVHLLRSISAAALEGLSSLLGSFSILPQAEQPKGLTLDPT